MVRENLLNLQLYCMNKSLGCKKILVYEQFKKHLIEECHYRIIKCSAFPNCNFEGGKNSVVEHLITCKAFINISKL